MKRAAHSRNENERTQKCAKGCVFLETFSVLAKDILARKLTTMVVKMQDYSYIFLNLVGWQRKKLILFRICKRIAREEIANKSLFGDRRACRSRPCGSVHTKIQVAIEISGFAAAASALWRAHAWL
jgi:hypothetical protein